MDYQTTETSEVKKIGKIKPSKKIAHLTARSGNINFIGKEATIEGRYISGLGLDDVIFKLTICDDDTIDFEEISETNKTDFETRKRYIEDILNSDTVPYNKLSVFADYKFMSVEKFSNRHVELYLAQELVKPIDRLRELSNYDNLSTSTLSKLDALFEEDDFKTEEDELKDLVSSLQSKNEPQILAEIEFDAPVSKSNYMEEAAKKAKELKLQELKSKLESLNNRLNNERFSLNSISKIVEDLEAEIKLTNSRIDSMTTEIVLNGYSFYVSPAIENKLDIDEEFAEKLLEKLPKNINGKALLRLFEQCKYALHLEKDGVEVVKYEDLSDEIKKSLSGKGLSVESKATDDDDKFIIISAEDWHDIVKSFERTGFFRDMDMAKRLDPLYIIETAEETLASMGVNIPTANQAPIPMTIGVRNGSSIFSNKDEEIDEEDEELDEEDKEIMDDKFIFAIYKDDSPDCTNSLDKMDPEFNIHVTPYTYWKTENFPYDDHTEHILKKKFPILKSLGQRLGEECESDYTILDESFDKFLNLEEILTILDAAGLKFNIDHQNHVSVKDTQMVLDEINRLGFQNIII